LIAPFTSATSEVVYWFILALAVSFVDWLFAGVGEIDEDWVVVLVVWVDVVDCWKEEDWLFVC